MRWQITGSLLLLAACGSSGPGGSSKIGNAGGKVTTADGTVDVPAGAVSAETTFTVVATPDAPAPAKATIVGTPLTLGPEGATFSKPVTVTLVVDPAKLPMGKAIGDVVVYTAPKGSTQYTRLFTKVIDATHVQALTTHFSVFVATLPGACSVTCSVGASVSAGPGTPGGGVSMPSCGCSSTCLPDGTNAPPCSVNSGPNGGGGSGGAGGSNSFDAGTCQSSGMTFALSCTSSGCTCTGGAGANLACSSSTTIEQAFAAYQACGGPGELAPPPPAGSGATGGTPSGDGGTTGGGGSGSGPNGCSVGAIGDCPGCSVTCQTGQATCVPPMTPPMGSCIPATCTCQ